MINTYDNFEKVQNIDVYYLLLYQLHILDFIIPSHTCLRVP